MLNQHPTMKNQKTLHSRYFNNLYCKYTMFDSIFFSCGVFELMHMKVDMISTLHVLNVMNYSKRQFTTSINNVIFTKHSEALKNKKIQINLEYYN